MEFLILAIILLSFISGTFISRAFAINPLINHNPFINLVFGIVAILLAVGLMFILLEEYPSMIIFAN